MCKEDIEELERGQQAALLLAEHLEGMYANEIIMLTFTDTGCYQITIVKTL